MFVHAGILPILVQRLDYLNIDDLSKLKYLNTIVRKWLLHKLIRNDQDWRNKSLFIDDQKLSPFWTRVYGMIPKNSDLKSQLCVDSVKKVLEVYKIGHIIVGHTPQLYTNNDGINGTCYETDGDNKLFRVDGGFAKAFKVFGDYDLIQVLEILNDTQFNIIRDMKLSKQLVPPQTPISENQMKAVASIYSRLVFELPVMRFCE